MIDIVQPNGMFPQPLHDNEIIYPKPYPIEALSLEIQQIAREIERFSKVSPVGPAITGLAAISIALGKKAIVEEREGLRHFPSIFFLGIAKSGERKSDSFRLMQAPLLNWEKAKQREHQALLRDSVGYNDALKIKMARIQKSLSEKDITNEREISLNSQLAAIRNDKKAAPPTPRLFSTNVTEEQLFRLMHDRNGVFAIMSGEGRPVIDAIKGRYSKEGYTGDSIYLAGISGDKISRDRVGSNGISEECDIYDPCLTVCVFIQPDKYEEMIEVSKLRQSGAIARMLACEMPSRVGRRFEEVGEEGLKKEELNLYNAKIERVLSVPHREEPHVATLTAAASELRRSWFNSVESKLGESEEYEDVQDIASKIVSTGCKIALLLHIFENPDLISDQSSKISEEILRRAILIANFHLHESVRLLRMANSKVKQKPEIILLKWLLAKDKTRFRISEIVNHVTRKGELRETDVLTKTCMSLVSTGWLGFDAQKREYIVVPSLRQFMEKYGYVEKEKTPQKSVEPSNGGAA